MQFLQALAVILMPLSVLFLPGISFVPLKKNQNILAAGAKIIIWSMGVTALTTLGAAIIGIPLHAIFWLILGVTLGCIAFNRTWFFTKEHLWRVLAIIVPILFISALFSIPFFLVKDGLPTGDSQKAIFWANQITETNSLPNYSISSSQLNRDPVDFFTPALHTLTSYIQQFSIQPLTNVGFFAIVVAVSVALIGAAILKELFQDKAHVTPPLLAALLILTNIRFLRYIREPGYHYQNLLGEFFLFSMVFATLRLAKKWSWHDAALVGISGISLVFTHQFSAFIGFFIVITLGITLLAKYKNLIRQYFKHHLIGGGIIAGVLFLMIILFFSLNLQSKIPHLFTTDAHLKDLSPTLLEYPTLMGSVWFIAGIAGLLLLIKQWKDQASEKYAVSGFIAITTLLLVLSQAPRLFIDIPPVRVLFFSVVPLSITAAYFFAQLRHATLALKSQTQKAIMTGLLIALIVIPAGSSTYTAFASSTRSARTNSTLSAQQLTLIEAIKNRTSNQSDAILIDDYNKRSTSWFLLTNQPQFARIAADLERQMEEADQSDQRYALYLKQLDYEKIFSLGSREDIAHLLNKHDIKWLTGIDTASTTSFKYNPALVDIATADNTTIFEKKKDVTCPADSQCTWLLRASTLVNDIGDREDTYEHLPASLRSPNISEPQYDGRQTFRVTNAPLIPLKFNVGDYTDILWDKEHTGRPDIAVELLIDFATNPGKIFFQTPSGETQQIQSGKIIRIEANEVPFDKDGFITIILLNPDQKPVAIDLIALGLARVP